MRELSMLSGSDLRRSVLRILVTSVLVGLLFGTLGPFGTFERMATAERYAFWMACILAGACLHVPAYWLSRYVGALYGWPQLVLLPLSAVLAAIPMTLMVNGIAVSLLGASTLDGFVELYPLVLAISLPVQLMSHLLQLWAEGKLAPETPASPDAGGQPDPAAASEPPLQVMAESADLADRVNADQELASSAPAPAIAPAIPSASEPVVVAAPSMVGGLAPRFLARIPARLGRDLLALEMEDHYLRVHTRLGSDLILIRMRDAVAELDGLEGLQVHRSWWVARAAVDRIDRDGKTMKLSLVNGLSVTVARDRQGEVRAAGWVA